MAAPLPPQIIDLLLLGAPDRRRQLQDLPILGDVWSRLAKDPNEPQDLLIIPCRGHTAGDVAELIQDAGERQNKAGDRSVAFLDGIVVTTLTLDDIISQVLPFTVWWRNVEEKWASKASADLPLSLWIAYELLNLFPRGEREKLDAKWAKTAQSAVESSAQQAARLGTLLGVFKAAGMEFKVVKSPRTAARTDEADPASPFKAEVERLGAERIIRLGAAALRTILDQYPSASAPSKRVARRGAIFQVTLNREAELALTESVSAIKADAARTLFSISCSKLAWAVLDSGIDYTHPAFLDRSRADQPDNGKLRPHRIREAFDFTRIRAILGVKDGEVSKLAAELAAATSIKKGDALKCLKKIVDDRKAKSPVDWHNVEELISLDVISDNKLVPAHAHGTHVAGIIAADWRDEDLTGVCPDIWLYDLRVLGSDLGDSEFAVSAALQFIRYYNEQGGYQRINGVNMSLAIRHNVRNYACGQTPVCVQAEALVSNGVVVVAAAGNRGYQQYQLADQTTFEGYAASSITDPGNAEGVITVGATHRSWPHTYGVSFFSSRGPTGDGRLKPDLLAPGEKITSSVPGRRSDVMDGTSMAAPHVSGAAALLMARHEELKGRPARIKEILCATATDLHRERSFQGHGMVDVLRAIQSI